MQIKLAWEKSSSWVIVQKTQNVEFFLTTRLKYEVEILDVGRGAWKQQILLRGFGWVWSGMPGHAKLW